MNPLTKYITFALSLSIVFSSVACAQKYTYASVEPDYASRINEDVMHIGAWVAPPPPQKAGDMNYCTQEAYNDIAACGINNIGGFYECTALKEGDVDAIERALIYAENAGIGMYVCDWNFGGGNSIFLKDDEAIHARMDKYAKYDSFAGAIIRDEPKISEFDTLRRIKEGWDRVFPDKEGFINLNPMVQTYAYLGLNEGENYQEHYVRRYVEEVKPKVLAFDNYPMMVDGWGEPSIQAMFLKNLESCAEEAKRANLPLWCFIQALSYNPSTRSPNEAELRYQILTSMAYGVKGYKYFSYWTLDHDGAPDTAAMVSKKGEKTDAYYAAQTINREVLAFDHVYLNYDWEGTMCVLGEGNTKNKCFSMLSNPLQSHERIKSVKANQDTVIGTFKDKNNNDAFMVVNFSDPAYGLSDTVELQLKGASKAVCYIQGIRSVVETKKGKLNLQLPPGNGAFVIPLQ